MAAAAGGEGNSACKELQADKFLNAMLMADGSACKDTNTPSYQCSGLFLHGRDPSIGDSVSPYFDVVIPPANLSSDIPEGVIGTSCPVLEIWSSYNSSLPDNSDAMTLPFWCPSSDYRPSFTYIRGDIIASPWPSDNGILFSYQPIQNISSSQDGVSFWDDRLAAFFPSDAATYGRLFCGLGPKPLPLLLGLGFDAQMKAEQIRNAMERLGGGCQYVENITRIQEYADELLPGIRLTCPEVITSGSAYIKRLQNITEGYLQLLWSDDEKAIAIKNQSIDGVATPSPFSPNATNVGSLLDCYFNSPDGCFGNGFSPSSDFKPLGHDMQCAVLDDRFDNVFVETAQRLDKALYVDNMFSNEVVMNPYGGIPYEEVFKYMALYTTTSNTPEEQYNTLLGAEFIYNTTGIRVPAVLVNLDPTADPEQRISCLDPPSS